MKLEELLKTWDAAGIKKLEPRTLVVHPQRYTAIREHLLVSGELQDNWNPNLIVTSDIPFIGIRIVQDPHMPLTMMVRVRRWLSKRDRKRTWIRKYRRKEVEVLGYWLYPNEMKPVFMK